ncbi:MAG: ribonuclease R [Verrucomicrobiota bacterium]|nr:ribonuclease R [Verrucomicrobiota bacterium]
MEEILKLLGRHHYTPSNVRVLLEKLGWHPSRQKELAATLRELTSQGKLIRLTGNRYALPPKSPPISHGRPSFPTKTSKPVRHMDKEPQQEIITGRIRFSKGGTGFIDATDGKTYTVIVAKESAGSAMHNDRVAVRILGKRTGTPARGGDMSGEVVEIQERSRKQFVGTFLSKGRSLIVQPDDPRMPDEIHVSPPRDVGRPVHDGDKVVVELSLQHSGHGYWHGRIVEVLGPPDEEGVDMLSIIRNYDLPLRFPEGVLAEAEAIGKEIKPEDLQGRVDCRGHLVITIDPEDAKDFDDAICIKREGNSRWRAWVHIADVSHYVKTGSALDREAAKRGNSTYLVDRVIPMLPEALSNELCSLKPNVDRLTKCVEFVLGEAGEVLESKIYTAVIHSKRRFSYPEALKILQSTAVTEVEQMLHNAHKMAQKLRANRMRAGALDLEFPEVKIRLDEKGEVSSIEKIYNDISHQLIEEFMLLANEAVATELMRSQKGRSVFRVHEAPTPQKLDEFREELGIHDIRVGNLMNRMEVQRMLKLLHLHPSGPALKVGFLKSLMRARYGVEPLGHYGLAKSDYTHFTSPIRRYADLLVHRALFNQPLVPKGERLDEVTEHISETERTSDDAERDTKAVKLHAYLEKQLSSGDLVTYSAMILEARPFGLFIEVPDLDISGGVPMSCLSDDYYEFDKFRHVLVGRRTGRIMRPGGKIQVQVAKVNRRKREVDFTLAREGRKATITEERPRRPSPRARHQVQARNKFGEQRQRKGPNRHRKSHTEHSWSGSKKSAKKSSGKAHFKTHHSAKGKSRPTISVGR